MKYSLFLIVSAAFLVTFCGNAYSLSNGGQDSIRVTQSRSIILLNDRWEYLEDNVEKIADLWKSSKQWIGVHLPHTWNALDAVDQIPGYRRSASWYTRKIFIPENAGDHRFILCFEGVNIKSKVFVNDQLAGEHVGGYVGFEVDITPYLEKGEENTIAVRANNSYDLNIIPSQKSDFFIYGGITRNVWLRVLPSTFVSKVLVRTPNVSKESAETECTATVVNRDPGAKKFVVDVVIQDNQGKQVGKKEVQVMGSNETTEIVVKLPDIRNPKLWSPSSPSLYSAHVSLKQSGSVIDQTSERFGYRWYQIKEHGPFYLNGERLLLRGTHRHEDYAGYGMAMPDSLQRKDIRMIKEMGANFVRLAHYPQAPEVYRACDELGLLVWDELPWCRGGVGGREWKANTRRLLKEQIAQNFNHPSIIIWSLGNESYWLPDIPGGDSPDSLRAFTKELNAIAHQLDPDRLTAVRKIDDVADLVDVFSPSIWAGWYSSYYKNYETMITSARDKYHRVLHVEYGGDSHVGRHTENPITGDGLLLTEAQNRGTGQKPVKNISVNSDWSENYIVNLFDWHLHVSEQLDWLSGNAQWAFKDFGTPLRPEDPIPYINQKGVVDRAGNPKDAYYVFKSYWTTDPKFCYIESHTWTDRAGPQNVQRQVKVFSNCEEVELFLNGASLGKRTKNIKDFPASGLRWDVVFLEGENAIIAVGYAGGRMVTEDSLKVRYTYKKIGEPATINLSFEKQTSGRLLITALAVDINGRRCLEYNKSIYFSNLGAGTLVVDQGTPTGSRVIEMANGKAQVEFIPDPAREMIIEARNQDLKGNYLVISNQSSPTD